MSITMEPRQASLTMNSICLLASYLLVNTIYGLCCLMAPVSVNLTITNLKCPVCLTPDSSSMECNRMQCTRIKGYHFFHPKTGCYTCSTLSDLLISTSFLVSSYHLYGDRTQVDDCRAQNHQLHHRAWTKLCSSS